MNLEDRINAFANLGDILSNNFFLEYTDLIDRACLNNPWFTSSSIKMSLDSWGNQLTKSTLHAWLDPYKLLEPIKVYNILVVMAGNIPLVGFHDLLAVLISGHKLTLKLSSNDSVLIPVIIKILTDINPGFKSRINIINEIRCVSFDVVIATGSDTSTSYFNYYFNKSSNIIRGSRSSIAILDGKESEKDLNRLTNDIFSFFGLGCRSVSKLLVPKGYDFDLLFGSFYRYSYFLEHTKYANNYDYNKAMLLMGNNKFIENGFFIIKEDISLFSPVGMIYYEYYNNYEYVDSFISKNKNKLQCIISRKHIPFGSSQNPNLWDYADDVDTIEFLRSL